MKYPSQELRRAAGHINAFGDADPIHHVANAIAMAADGDPVMLANVVLLERNARREMFENLKQLAGE